VIQASYLGSVHEIEELCTRTIHSIEQRHYLQGHHRLFSDVPILTNNEGTKLWLPGGKETGQPIPGRTYACCSSHSEVMSYTEVLRVKQGFGRTISDAIPSVTRRQGTAKAMVVTPCQRCRAGGATKKSVPVSFREEGRPLVVIGQWRRQRTMTPVCLKMLAVTILRPRSC